MKPPVKRNLRTLLFNPFAIVAGAPALAFGSAAILVAGLIASFGFFHFDGALDFHGPARRAFWIFFAEGLVDWLCVALVLLAIGRVASRTPFRTIDLFGTQAMARSPSILIASIASVPGFRRSAASLMAQLRTGHGFTLRLADGIVYGVVTLGILGLVCWMVALMYQSYRVSCNVRGGKSVGTFIAGLILAEALSKIAIHWLFKIAAH